MKKILCLICLLSVFLSGCDPRVLPVSQTKNDIEQIELLYSSVPDVLLEDMVVLCTLTDADADSVWDALQKITVEKHFSAPPSYCGQLVVSIHYKNGGNDILGTGICLYEYNGRTHYNNYYYLNFEETHELFSKWGLEDNTLAPQ